MTALLAFLNRLAAGHFFGTITLKFERGVVVSVRTEQVIKPEELEQVRVVK